MAGSLGSYEAVSVMETMSLFCEDSNPPPYPSHGEMTPLDPMGDVNGR